MKNVKLAIAPIAWTNDDLPELGSENTFEQCVSEMALAGYKGSEVGNKYPKDVDELNKALELRGLTICNAWFSSTLLSEGLEKTLKNFQDHIDFIYEVGARVVGISEQGNSIQGKDVPIFDNKPNYTDEEWELIRVGFNKMGELANAKGMKLTVHHHMGTGVQTAEEVDKLMELTDPNLVHLLYDCGHLAFSGDDYIAVLKKHVDRVAHVHLKDVRPAIIDEVKDNKLCFLDAVKMGAFTVPGDGALDFDSIFDILKEANYEGWMVVEAEQDPAKANPLEYALKARTFIKEKTGL